MNNECRFVEGIYVYLCKYSIAKWKCGHCPTLSLAYKQDVKPHAFRWEVSPKTHFGGVSEQLCFTRRKNLNRWRSTHTMICSLGNAMVLGYVTRNIHTTHCDRRATLPNVLCRTLLYFVQDIFKQVRKAYVCKYTC